MTDNNKPMTPPVDFQMGIVKIGGDAVKVEEKPPAKKKSTKKAAKKKVAKKEDK